jgi:flagellar basal body-associated protein FliL
MANTDVAAAAPPAKRGLSLVWLILIIVAPLAAAGGGAWYYFRAEQKPVTDAHPAEAPLPFTLAIKPFVVSVGSSDGSSHFIQLGPNLQLPGSSAGDVVNNVLPQVQDVMRETLLSYKSEDLQSVEGINKMRATMIKRLNETLLQVLGPNRIAHFTGSEGRGLVENIYFPTLVIE